MRDQALVLEEPETSILVFPEPRVFDKLSRLISPFFPSNFSTRLCLFFPELKHIKHFCNFMFNSMQDLDDNLKVAVIGLKL